MALSDATVPLLLAVAAFVVICPLATGIMTYMKPPEPPPRDDPEDCHGGKRVGGNGGSSAFFGDLQ